MAVHEFSDINILCLGRYSSSSSILIRTDKDKNGMQRLISTSHLAYRLFLVWGAAQK